MIATALFEKTLHRHPSKSFAFLYCLLDGSSDYWPVVQIQDLQILHLYLELTLYLGWAYL